MALHPDPWRAVDRQCDPARLAGLMEARALHREPAPPPAENAVEFGLVSSAAAAGWLAEIERIAARGEFVFTLNFYGAAGVKPVRPGGSAA